MANHVSHALQHALQDIPSRSVHLSRPWCKGKVRHFLFSLRIGQMILRHCQLMHQLLNERWCAKTSISDLYDLFSACMFCNCTALKSSFRKSLLLLFNPCCLKLLDACKKVSRVLRVERMPTAVCFSLFRDLSLYLFRARRAFGNCSLPWSTALLLHLVNTIRPNVAAWPLTMTNDNYSH